MTITGSGRTFYANPHSGEFLGEAAGRTLRAFFTRATDLHRYLAVPGTSVEAGARVTGAANASFLFMVVSGMYLWWPRMWTAARLRNIVWFRLGLIGRAREFNWHNTLGFFFALPLTLVAAAGVVISYPGAGQMLERAIDAGASVLGHSPATTDDARPWRAPVVASDVMDVSSPTLETAVSAAVQYEPSWSSVTLFVPVSTGCADRLPDHGRRRP